ncbi:MAG: aromatic ring-hydroxylating dioxygenase subunit alpha [Cellvibrionaceae bacterium]|nr:aromatic ring-hydroxylating dioxygenase subunit alpha [Cellvibrionaceae bacterium]
MTIKIGKKPIEASQLLPREAYYSEEWFRREQEHLFSKVWTFACSMDELSEPGDYVCLQVGKYPMVVLHDREGQLHALHNICRHRGSILLQGRGNLKGGILCPYHRWTYARDGKLRGVPQEKELFSEKLDKCTLSLKKGALGNFRNLIFIHPQEQPSETFDEFLGDLPQHSWPAKTEELKVLTCTAWEMNCNWKTFVENAQDGYHLSHLHKSTLMGPSTGRQEWQPRGRHWHWKGLDPIMSTAMEKMSSIEKAKAGLSALMSGWKPLPGVDVDSYGGEVFGIFPNFAIQPLLDNVGFAKIIPVSPNKTLLEVFIMVAPWSSESEKAKRLKFLADFAPLPGVGYAKDGDPNIRDRPLRLKDITGHPMESGNFHVEDVWQVEMIAEAIESPAFEIGPLSNGEGETALSYFQQMLLDYLQREEGGLNEQAKSYTA